MVAVHRAAEFQEHLAVRWQVAGDRAPGPAGHGGGAEGAGAEGLESSLGNSGKLCLRNN